MKARLVVYWKRSYPGEYIVEAKVWELPEKTSERPHGLKYSLFLGRPGKRIIGYDNEAGKGDHRHFKGREAPYRFVTLRRLLRDFEVDVKKELGL